ncbi:alkaline phosphatase family protein [Streptomyces decoyicus]|uniref:alkaline phosphatase family protein n=1 Tax=Streptomyces decoyicus TaxID=249567 RepID=UPI0004AB3907|nr:acid phosphatase [Streptomyces decoyicus]QZY19248.1 putative Ig domain-containing protein [Streptomyces decoyicus]
MKRTAVHLRRALVAMLGALGLTVAATTADAHPTPTGAAVHASGTGTRAALPSYDHVVIVVFENKQYGEIIGSSQAPYLNQLAQQGAELTGMKALTHPSQPNYFNLFSGTTQGVTGDGCYTAQSMTAPNLGQELIAAGKTFASYNEGLPEEGATTCSAGRYAQKHNPWFAFENVPLNTAKTFAQFPKDDFTKLPTVSFVIPDMCNDMHDCAVGSGDTWTKNNLASYATWAEDHNSLLMVTWDEDNYLGSNRIATVFHGAHVRQGSVSGAYNHFSLLRTVEDMYGTGHAGNAASAAPVTGVFDTDGTEPPDGGLQLTAPGPQTCRFAQECTVQLTATGGTPPLTYRATGLPLGLGADAAGGRIGGRPWQTGTFPVTATATDSTGATATVTFPLTVNWF